MKPINIPPFKVGDRVYSETRGRTRTVDRVWEYGKYWFFCHDLSVCMCMEYKRINEETPDQRPEVPENKWQGRDMFIDCYGQAHPVSVARSSERPTHLWGIPVVYDTPPTASGSGQ